MGMYSTHLLLCIRRLCTVTQALCLAAAAAPLWRMWQPLSLGDAALERIRRAERLLLALLEQVKAGRLPVRRPREGSADRVPVARARTIGRHLPRRPGWLVEMMPADAAVLAGHLRGVLAEPEMVALVAEVPQAGRILRPVCRMLGIEREFYSAAADEALAPAVMTARAVYAGSRPDAAAVAVAEADPPAPRRPMHPNIHWRLQMRPD